MRKKLTAQEAERRAVRKARNKKLYKISFLLFAFAAVLLAVVMAATGDL